MTQQQDDLETCANFFLTFQGCTDNPISIKYNLAV